MISFKKYINYTVRFSGILQKIEICEGIVFFSLVAENEEMPTELRADALDIQKTLDWDDEGGEGNCHSKVKNV